MTVAFTSSVVAIDAERLPAQESVGFEPRQHPPKTARCVDDQIIPATTLDGFGTRLAAIRQSRGLTQTELGGAAGVRSPNYVTLFL
jgi:hypothetical protein